jgi:formylglycine-generating enzyme
MRCQLFLVFCLVVFLSCSSDEKGRLGPDDFVYTGDVTLVEAGSFVMGDAQSVVTTPHHVTLTRDFYIGNFEVTNAEFSVMLNWALDQGYLETASALGVTAHGQQLIHTYSPTCEIKWGGDGFVVIASNYAFDGYGPGEAYPQSYSAFVHPVTEVTWYGAACFCDWLSLKEGVEPFYKGDWTIGPYHNPYDAEGYRLPTEAEWEYAARYPDSRPYPWGDAPPTCELANFVVDSWCVGWTSEVGSYPLGDSYLGLSDMSGNVWEWCNDRFQNFTQESRVDPGGPTTATERILRGGNWTYGASYLETYARSKDDPITGSMKTGLRIVRSY